MSEWSSSYIFAIYTTNVTSSATMWVTISIQSFRHLDGPVLSTGYWELIGRETAAAVAETTTLSYIK